MSSDISKIPEQRIALKLSNSESIPISEFQIGKQNSDQISVQKPFEAAVLIPLCWIQDEWHVLFTRRVDSLPEHSGQVSFPGGRFDPLDNNLEITALRESFEEIGLLPEDVKILGVMSTILTVTNYLVTPVVGVIPWPYNFKLSQKEVTRIFTIPLNWLANLQNHEVRFRNLPGSDDPIPVIYFKLYDGEILWGASARIILSFIRIVS